MTQVESSDSAEKIRLPLTDEYGRNVDDSFIRRQVDEGRWTPHLVKTDISGMPRDATIFLAKRKANLIKWSYHGDIATFCPPHWADLAIGSGACGFGCRACFLVLTWRALRDPLRPVLYSNIEDYCQSVRNWLLASKWPVEYAVRANAGSGKTKKEKRIRARTHKDSMGLGIDCADSLLWEGVVPFAREIIPLFTNAATNPLHNTLILLTKSANTHYLAEIAEKHLHRLADGTIPNVVITMSLNPEAVADAWEGRFPDTGTRITPPIARRLEALRHAQEMGFEVRARIDPILPIDGWEDLYAEFFHDMAHRFGVRPRWLTLGTYREKNSQLELWQVEKWGMPPMEYDPETTVKRDGTHHHLVGRGDIYTRVRELIEDGFAGTAWTPSVSLCKETHAVRKATGLTNADCNCLTGGLVSASRLAAGRKVSA